MWKTFSTHRLHEPSQPAHCPTGLSTSYFTIFLILFATTIWAENLFSAHIILSFPLLLHLDNSKLSFMGQCKCHFSTELSLDTSAKS